MYFSVPGQDFSNLVRYHHACRECCPRQWQLEEEEGKKRDKILYFVRGQMNK